jgi:hypothetical protein
LHVLVDGVHVVNVSRWIAATVSGKVSRFSAIEAGSLRALSLVILLYWGIRYVAKFWLGRSGDGVRIVALVLASVIGCPGAR